VDERDEPGHEGAESGKVHAFQQGGSGLGNSVDATVDVVAFQFRRGKARALDDPYQTLGVPHDATPDAIRAAYLKLAKQHHPDLNPGDAKAEAAFKGIAGANDILSDPEKRGKFDRGEIDASGQERAPRSSYRDHADGEAGRRYSRADARSGDWNEEEFGDIFSSMFGEGRQGGGGPRRGADATYSLATSFLDTVNGATLRLNLPDETVLDVKVPPGTADGQTLRLRGKGNPGRNGGPSGDARIEIHAAPHRYFQRDGRDVRLILPVTLSEAVLGGDVEVPTPRGPVRMRVPPHSDDGTELRLKGRGVPAHGDLAAGDLYARLNVVIGPPDEALEAFLRDWKPEHATNPRREMKEPT
jgi:DnaJ-class molecular chaperone